ncbi:MAG TPA: antirestriction protein ArdA [Acidimicrobiales bacterium]|nr:antirestriction protein ArdA [Acidimicrobiales bacterium]
MTGPGETPAAPEMEPRDGPRVYVASLSDYNAGVLHGAWLNADQPVEDLEDGINTMLAASPTTRRYGDRAEEWAIHDHEGFGPDIALGEYESLERVSRLARGLIEHGDAFGAWISIQDDQDQTSEDFTDHFAGEHASLTDWGTELLDELGFDPSELPGVPESLRPYVQVDVEAWTRDMVCGGDIDTVGSKAGVYVFWP